MARLLITGGAGFIGSHTCVVLLEAGHRLLVLDDFSNSSPVALERIAELADVALGGEQLQLMRGDVRDAALLESCSAKPTTTTIRSKRSSTSPASRPWVNPSPIRCATGM